MTKPSTITKPAVPMLYLLTNDDEFELLYHKLDVALKTGAIGLLQIRRKQVLAQPNGETKLYEEAKKIVALAQKYEIPVVINDDIALASKLGVGVHLGQGDGDIDEAKQMLAPHQIIGRTCHGDVGLVKEAKQAGATYAAMGAVFVSSTKPHAHTITYQQLAEGCQQNIDLCVIGGLTPENVVQLKALPLTYIAVVGDIMDLPLDSIGKRCYEWQKALTHWHTPVEEI